MDWEEHVAFLFHEHCNVQRVLGEAQFANDNGVDDRDSILSQLSKQGARESMRRPMRLFQKLRSKQKDDTGTRKGPEAVTREPVVETMNRKSFTTTLLLINPTLKVDHIEDIFEEALEYAHLGVLRDLELIWMHVRTSTTEPDEEEDSNTLGRALDSYSRSLSSPTEKHSAVKKPPIFYVNTRTQLAQWRKPYEPHTYRAKDIEYGTFLHILISKNILAQSPLHELLHMTPKDLWPNADMFLKQIAKGLIGNKK